MRAGQMDRIITIEYPVDVETEYGPMRKEWIVFMPRVPAQVKDALPSSSETFQNGLQQADLPARVRMRYLRGVTPEMRIVVHNEQDDIYQIDSMPAEIGRREWTEFTVRAFRA